MPKLKVTCGCSESSSSLVTRTNASRGAWLRPYLRWWRNPVRWMVYLKKRAMNAEKLSQTAQKRYWLVLQAGSINTTFTCSTAPEATLVNPPGRQTYRCFLFTLQTHSHRRFGYKYLLNQTYAPAREKKYIFTYDTAHCLIWHSKH